MGLGLCNFGISLNGLVILGFGFRPWEFWAFKLLGLFFLSFWVFFLKLLGLFFFKLLGLGHRVSRGLGRVLVWATAVFCSFAVGTFWTCRI